MPQRPSNREIKARMDAAQDLKDEITAAERHAIEAAVAPSGVGGVKLFLQCP